MPTGARTLPLVRTDLMIRALDLRIRLALLPGRDSKALADPAVLSAARSLLIENPETASIALIADDAELTCRIVEPFDSPDVTVPAPTDPEQSDTSAITGPAAPLLREYLLQIDPGWQQAERVAGVTMDLAGSANEAAAGALAELQAKRKNTAEARQAREGLTASDAAWIAQLALDVLEDKITAPGEEVQRRSKRDSS